MRVSRQIGLVVLLLLACTWAHGAAVHDAAAKGDSAKLSALLKGDAGLLNAADVNGATPLHYAVASGRVEAVKLLISRGANVNAAKKNGITPLHIAASLGLRPIAELLVAAKADAGAKDGEGRTPFDLAKANGRTDLCELLRAKSISSPVGSADLSESAEKVRWLALPQSRIVINPNVQMLSPMGGELKTSLPMDLAYYVGTRPLKLPSFWSWQPGGMVRAAESGPSANFSPESAGDWKEGGVNARFEGDRVRVAVAPGQTFGALEIQVTVDLDQTPYLMVEAASVDSQWAVKVNSGTQAVDTYLIKEQGQAGAVIADVGAVTGWRGMQTFTIRLFSEGKGGDTTVFSGVRFISAKKSDPSSFAETKAVRYPHELVVNAGSDAEAMSVETTTCFADESTIVQRLKVQSPGTGRLTLLGYAGDASLVVDGSRRGIHIRQGKYSAMVAVSRQGSGIAVYPSWGDWLCGTPKDGATSGIWAISYDNLNAGDEIVVAARIVPEGVECGSVADLADTTAFRQALAGAERGWNERLARVPHPADFKLNIVSPHGATPEEIRKAYYRAWVFMLSDILPPLPEGRYPYSQLCCGKASLWGEGHAKAPASSQWESFLAMQFVAPLYPDVAWSACEGLLSLVDAQGTFGGEGLPSRHAQTAWQLYSYTGERERLAGVYPAAKRLLLWKASDPRWIYANQTPKDSKDAEFVVHVLVEMGYMRQIAKALNLQGEADFWTQKIAEYGTSYRNWFWDRPGERPYRIFYASSGNRDDLGGVWGVQGIVLPPEVLSPEQKESILALYRELARDDVPFVVPSLVKHPHVNYTIRGLWQYGQPMEAARLVEGAMRSVTLAGEFTENYSNSFPVTGSGVTPSVFGAANIIDACLWHNGIVLGDGLPSLAHVPNAVGVGNLMMKSGTVDVKWGEPGDGVEIWGKGLSGLHVPDGFTATALPDGTPKWKGTLSIGKDIRLAGK